MAARNHHRRSRPRSMTLGLQPLEPRLPMAGDVSVAFQAGVLTITGDNQANDIWVGRMNGDVVVAPNLLGLGERTRLVHVRGGQVHGDNGQIDGISFRGVHTLNVDLKGGDDQLFISSWPATPRTLGFRNLTANLGSGNNRLDVRDIAVQRNLTVRAGGGDDRIAVANVPVRGGLSVDAGHGDNEIDVSDGDMTGPINLVAGRGHDRITVSETASRRSLTVRAGDGDNYFGLWNEDGAPFAGRVNVTTGAGNDEVVLGTNFSQAAIEVRTGSGDDVVRNTGPLQARSLAVHLGPGDNQATLSGSLNGPLIVAGPLTVTSGAGHDLVSLQNLDVRGRLTVRAGDGDNLVSLNNVSTDNRANADIATGRGADRVFLVNSNIRGTLKLRTGAGADEAWLLAVRARGIDLDLGDGDDKAAIVAIASTDLGRRVRFTGGRGRDTVHGDWNPLGQRFFASFEEFVDELPEL